METMETSKFSLSFNSEPVLYIRFIYSYHFHSIPLHFIPFKQIPRQKWGSVSSLWLQEGRYYWGIFRFQHRFNILLPKWQVSFPIHPNIYTYITYLSSFIIQTKTQLLSCLFCIAGKPLSNKPAYTNISASLDRSESKFYPGKSSQTLKEHLLVIVVPHRILLLLIFFSSSLLISQLLLYMLPMIAYQFIQKRDCPKELERANRILLPETIKTSSIESVQSVCIDSCQSSFGV